MHVTFGEILIWLIVGSLTGSIVGRLSTRYKKGYGRVPNLFLGLVGAVVGGVVFKS